MTFVTFNCTEVSSNTCSIVFSVLIHAGRVLISLLNYFYSIIIIQILIYTCQYVDWCVFIFKYFNQVQQLKCCTTALIPKCLE